MESPASHNALDGIFLTYAYIDGHDGSMYAGRTVKVTTAVPVYVMQRISSLLQERVPGVKCLSWINCVRGSKPRCSNRQVSRLFWYRFLAYLDRCRVCSFFRGRSTQKPDFHNSTIAIHFWIGKQPQQVSYRGWVQSCSEFSWDQVSDN